MVEGELIVPLVALLVRPEVLPSGQKVLVRGYLVKGLGPLLFLTAEHAEAFDTSAAIPVSDPSEDGSLMRADCFDRFVAVSGTFVRHESGEVTIQRTTKVEYRSASAAESKDWPHLYVTCWQMPAAAQQGAAADVAHLARSRVW